MEEEEQSAKFQKYSRAVADNPSDFSSWTCLLQTVEQENKLGNARKVFTDFLKIYPYCYGYWKKFADFEKKNGFLAEAKEIFLKGVKAIPYSVDLWNHFINFMMQSSKEEPDSDEQVRSLFEEAILVAGKDFRSDKLWDNYLDFERSRGSLQSVTKVFDTLLCTQTQHYTKQWEKFKEHVDKNKAASIVGPEEYLKLRAEVASIPPGVSISEENDPPGTDAPPGEAPPGADDIMEEALLGPPGDAASEIMGKSEDPYTLDGLADDKENDAEEASVKEKIIHAREEIFKKNEIEIKKRWPYEDSIKRPYFHVKPLERSQLKNWRDYLDFEMGEGDHQRICLLFERCLIACALYEDFWQKYVTYLEDKDTEACKEVYSRACTIHLPKKHTIHLAWAAFEEKTGCVEKAREVLENLENRLPGMVLVTVRRASVERRAGNVTQAVNILKDAMDRSASVEEKIYYSIKSARLCCRVMENKGAAKSLARTLLKRALELNKSCKRLYLQLLDLETSFGDICEKEINELARMVEGNEDLSDDFKQGFAQRRLEILEDFGSDISDILRAYESYHKKYRVRPMSVSGKKRSSDESQDVRNKSVKIEEATPAASSAPAVLANPQTAYQMPDPAAQVASQFTTYSPMVANQWSAYTAPAATANYCSWYNPYGYNPPLS